MIAVIGTILDMVLLLFAKIAAIIIEIVIIIAFIIAIIMYLIIDLIISYLIANKGGDVKTLSGNVDYCDDSIFFAHNGYIISEHIYPGLNIIGWDGIYPQNPLINKYEYGKEIDI